MGRRAQWWHTLQESRRQACLAVDFYNRASDRASFYDFVLHMHLAWQNLLHAELMRQTRDIYYRESNGWFKRGKDGQKRTWDLQRCLREEFADNDPVRANVEFFLGLRNKIEHRFQDAFIIETAAHAHALVLNYESELVRRFGAEESLATELRFPVFVQSLTPGGLDEQRALRRGLPATARTYITDFEASLQPGVKDDERFVYRVLLTPVKGPKSEADMAVTFVRQDQLDLQEMADLIHGEGMVIVTEKFRSVALADEMRPSQAAAAIEARIPFKFGVNDFTRLRQGHDIGRKLGKLLPKTEDKYCVYSKPYDDYVYTPAYIARCVKAVNTEATYRAAVGHDPVPKLSKVPTKTDVA